jgi:hypothetical protein
MFESVSKTAKLQIRCWPGGQSRAPQGNFTGLVTDYMKAALDPGLGTRFQVVCDLFSREVAGACGLWFIRVSLVQKSGV